MAKGSSDKILSQKELFRLSAILYADTNNGLSQAGLIAMIESTLFESKGYKTAEDLVAIILEKFAALTLDSEIASIATVNSNLFVKRPAGKQMEYFLTQKRLKELDDASARSIEHFIDLSIQELVIERVDEYKESIYKYLYKLTTTNINSYRIMLSTMKAFIVSGRIPSRFNHTLKNTSAASSSTSLAHKEPFEIPVMMAAT